MDKEKLKQNFDRDGFIFLPGFLDEPAINNVIENVDRFIRDIVLTMPLEQVYYDVKDEPDSLKQISQMYEFDDFFQQLMFASRFEEFAVALIGNPVRGDNLGYFNKMPGVSRPTPPHQDGFYFMLEPCEAVTMWLAMDHVDEDNGCVRYVKGSHKLGMRPHGKTKTLGFSQGVLDFPNVHDKANEVFFRVKPGDLLAHHALTVHWADSNQSKARTRKALGFMYYSQAAKKDRVGHEAHMKQLNAELAADGKI